MLWLEVIEGNVGEKMFPIRNLNDYVRIGRHSESTVYLPHPSVSKHHAYFVVRRGNLRCCVLDEGSKIFLNDAEATPPFDVFVGDCIKVGEFLLRFCSDEAAV